MFGVKMAKEIKADCDVAVPTEDFSVPEAQDLIEGLRAALVPLSKGKAVYVGCMGGKGRTGLFLAALAKLLGEKDPVTFVRMYYYLHAVETSEQKEFVDSLDLRSLRWDVRMAHVRSFFYRW
jgi:protein tyrosine phosphatase